MIKIINHLRNCDIKPGKRVLFEDPIRLFGVIIGCNLSIGAFTYMRGGRIAALKSIGRFCSIAPGLTVGDGEHPTHYLSTHPFQYKGVGFGFCREWIDFQTSTKSIKQLQPAAIGADVWIGANVTIMRGVNLGHGCVISPGSVVTRNVLPYEVVQGVPARNVRFRFGPEIVERLLKLKWWNYSLKSLQGVPFDKPVEALVELERRLSAGLLRKRPATLYSLRDNVLSIAARGSKLMTLLGKTASNDDR
ncbi:MAG: CatB-related O-acetyltransferase [Syntrophobacteraceae bacterium]